MGRDQGSQGRGGNLSEQDRSKGGQTSANEQKRDDQGQFTGTGMGNRQGGMGSEPGSEGGGQRGGTSNDPGSNLGNQGRDSQGQFTGGSRSGQTGQGRHGGDQGSSNR